MILVCLILLTFGVLDNDDDNDVDLQDFAAFQLAFTGSVTGEGIGECGGMQVRGGITVRMPGTPFDADADADVDLEDFAVFQASMTGPDARR